MVFRSDRIYYLYWDEDFTHQKTDELGEGWWMYAWNTEGERGQDQPSLFMNIYHVQNLTNISDEVHDYYIASTTDGPAFRRGGNHDLTDYGGANR